MPFKFEKPVIIVKIEINQDNKYLEQVNTFTVVLASINVILCLKVGNHVFWHVTDIFKNVSN